MSSAKWRPFWLSPNVLTYRAMGTMHTCMNKWVGEVMFYIRHSSEACLVMKKFADLINFTMTYAFLVATKIEYRNICFKFED